jgi:hypothetical protein
MSEPARTSHPHAAINSGRRRTPAAQGKPCVCWQASFVRAQLQHVMEQSRVEGRSEHELKAIEEQQDELQAQPASPRAPLSALAVLGRSPRPIRLRCAQARLLLVQQVMRLTTHARLAPLNREPVSPAYLRTGTELRVAPRS